jgi:hypothetical protein
MGFATKIEREWVMVERIDGSLQTVKARLQSTVIIAVVASILAGTGGLIYGRRTSPTAESKSNIPISEIIVANDKGLLFKSEDGTPLLKVGKDGFGTHVRLLDPSGATLVELNTLQGTGGITVGSKNGGYAYVQAHEESSTITLLGKYNKEAVEITSANADGSGSLSINEGKKGYHAVEIGAGPNRVKSKGTITIPSDNGVSWQAP